MQLVERREHRAKGRVLMIADSLVGVVLSVYARCSCGVQLVERREHRATDCCFQVDVLDVLLCKAGVKLVFKFPPITNTRDVQ